MRANNDADFHRGFIVKAMIGFANASLNFLSLRIMLKPLIFMRDATSRCSISKQFFKLLARGAFALVAAGLRRPVPQGKFKILAEIANVFFQHRLGSTLTALLGHARVVMDAVQADPQVGPASHAGFAAPGLAVQRPWFAAIVAMMGHLRFWIYDLRRAIAKD